MYFQSFFLFRGSVSLLERCGDTKFTNATKARLILLLVTRQRQAHDRLRGGLEGDTRTFTNKVEEISTTQLEAPNAIKKLYITNIEFQDKLFRLGYPNTQE
jgi:hypothetical protein